MEIIAKAIGGAVLVVVMIVVFGLILALPTMWLWDWLMPELFGLSEITWVQAWGVNMLSGILFRGTTSVNKD